MTHLFTSRFSAEEVIEEIKRARRVVLLSGAGISVASGIPDYRSGKGIFAKYPIEAYEIDNFRKNPQVQYSIKKEFWSHNYQPNQGHQLGVILEKKGILGKILTQNIDGLHYIGLSDKTKLIEFHGNLREAHCSICYMEADIQTLKEYVREDQIYYCPCGGPIKPKTVMYGEDINIEYLCQAEIEIKAADLILIIGTSLQVHPLAGLVRYINCPVIIFNNEIPETYPLSLYKQTKAILGEIENNCRIVNQELLR